MNDWTAHTSYLVTAERDKVVALGLRAGSTAAEMVTLTWGDVFRDADGVVHTVDERSVPMVRRYGRPLLAWRHGAPSHEYMLLWRVKFRTSEDVINKSMRGEANGFRPTDRRIRLTWIV